MYSLQNRTKHEVWREMGHGNNHALDCSRELPWVPLMWPVITRMRAPHGCWKSTPRFASQFGFPMRTPQHPTTQMPKWCQSDAKWCQMPRPPKITLPAEHMRIKADSVTSATLPSLFICSLRAVQTLFRSVLCDLCPELTHIDPSRDSHHGLWKSRSDHDGAAQTLLFTAMRRPSRLKTTLLSEIIWHHTHHTRTPSLLTTALGISYVFGDT